MKTRYIVFLTMICLSVPLVSFGISVNSDGTVQEPSYGLTRYAGYPLCADIIEKLNDGGPKIISESYILDQLSDGSPSYQRVEGYIHGDTPVLKLKIRVPLSVKGNTEINRDVVDDPDLEISKWLPNWPWSPVYIGNKEIKGFYDAEEVKAEKLRSHRYILSTLVFFFPAMKGYTDLFYYEDCWTTVDRVDVKKIEEVVDGRPILRPMIFHTVDNTNDAVMVFGSPELKFFSTSDPSPWTKEDLKWKWWRTDERPFYIYLDRDEYVQVFDPDLYGVKSDREFEKGTEMYHLDVPTHAYYVGPREDLKALVAAEYLEEGPAFNPYKFKE